MDAGLKQILTALLASVLWLVGIFIAFGVIPLDALKDLGKTGSEMTGVVLMLIITVVSCALILLLNKNPFLR